MFKPLLRTIPSLSGNAKLACILTGYTKVSDNVFDAYCKYATIKPLTTGTTNKIEANLFSSSWEYDIAKYYKAYKDIFYKSDMSFYTNDLMMLDKHNDLFPRNTNYEYGVSRLKYAETGNQLTFYAPIYIDSVNDLPLMFRIKLKLSNSKYDITKIINVNIANNPKHNSNYLYIYLNKYVKKIDNKVIYMNTDRMSVIYNSIDLLNGGFVEQVDTVNSSLYKGQYTINGFDAALNMGYIRNNGIMRQIIPLAFEFSINDILMPTEIELYKNTEMYIEGEWVASDETRSPFYDFSADYSNLYMLNRIWDDNIGDYANKQINIMSIYDGLSTFNEPLSYNYLYTNKITKVYNRWKLLYSPDSNPYYTNLSYAFSNSSVYNSFPNGNDKSTLLVNDIVNNKGSFYNVILPFGLTKKYYTNNYANLLTRYNSAKNNSISEWYTLISDYNEIRNYKGWANVSNNKVYYNGILYNLSELPVSLDKFAVFLKPDFTFLEKSNAAIYTNILISNNTGSGTHGTACNISNNLLRSSSEYTSLFKTNSASASINTYDTDVIMVEDNKNGNYINLDEFGFNYYDINCYYDTDELINLVGENDAQLIKDINELSIIGYELIKDIKLLKNLVKDSDFVFNTDDATIKFNKNLIYVSSNNAKTKLSDFGIKTIASQNTSSVYENSVYMKRNFITKSDVIYKLKLDVANLQEFLFHPVVKHNGIGWAYNCFTRILPGEVNKGSKITSADLENDTEFLYIDPYNLDNIITLYNGGDSVNPNIKADKSKMSKRRMDLFGTDEPIAHLTENDNSEYLYARFISKEHLLRYLTNIYDNSILNSGMSLRDILKTVYIKHKGLYMSEQNSELQVKDIYDNFTGIPFTNGDVEFNMLDTLTNMKEITEFIDTYFEFHTVSKQIMYVTLKESALAKFNSNGSIKSALFPNTKHGFNDLYTTETRFELVYRKKFVKLDDTLYKIINFEFNNNTQPYKDLYIFSLSNSLELAQPYEYIESCDIHNPTSTIVENTNKTLEPIFNDVYMQDGYDAIITKNYKTHIKPVTVTDVNKIYYRYNHNYDAMLMYDISNLDTMSDMLNINGKEYYIPNAYNFIFNIGRPHIGEAIIPEEYSALATESDYAITYHRYSIYNDPYITFDLGYETVTQELPIDTVVTETVDAIAEEYCTEETRTNYEQENGILLTYFKNDYVVNSDGVKLYKTLMPHKEEYSKVETIIQTTTNNTYFDNEKVYTINNDNNTYTTTYLNTIKVAIPHTYTYLTSYIYEVTYTSYYTYIDNDSSDSSNSQVLKYGIKADVLPCVGYTTNYAYTYTYELYGFYIVGVHGDLSSNSFNLAWQGLNNSSEIYVDDNAKLLSFNMVNTDDVRSLDDMDDTDINCPTNKYFNSIFNYIIPSYKLNIIKEFITNVSTVNELSEYNIDLKYIQQVADVNNNIFTYKISDANAATLSDIQTSYNIMHTSSKGKATLYRYLDDITPVLTESTAVPNTYNIKYKTNKATSPITAFVNDTIYSEHQKIYEYQPVRIYYKSDIAGTHYSLYEPTERKYYNDNKFINLDTSISIKVDKYLTYDELLIAETEENVLNAFTQYFNNSTHTYDNDSILFLYNKYHNEYDSTSIGIDPITNEKLYSLTYKFTLL